MSPDRRTVVWWAVGTTLILLVPMLILLGFSASTKGNTEDIKAAQVEAEQATAAAERNGTVSACSTTYARTYASWDSEAGRLFGIIIRAAFADEPPPEGTLDRYVMALANAAEVNGRGLGVAALSRMPGEFVCPPLPGRLVVAPIDPLDPNPPSP